MNSKFRFLLPICLGICCLMAVMDLSAKGIEDLNEKIKDYESRKVIFHEISLFRNIVDNQHFTRLSFPSNLPKYP